MSNIYKKTEIWDILPGSDIQSVCSEAYSYVLTDDNDVKEVKINFNGVKITFEGTK